MVVSQVRFAGEEAMKKPCEVAGLEFF